MLYQRKSRMTIRQQQKLLEHVVAGTTARAAAMRVGVQANTAIRFYQRLRRLSASKVARYELSGEVEADESDFGGVRKGRRGRGAAVSEDNPSLGQHLFDLTEAEAKPVVEPDGVTDNLRGKPITTVAGCLSFH